MRTVRLVLPRVEYQPRIVDTELDELMGGLPVVSLEGPKAVGKTETALPPVQRPLEPGLC